MKARALPEAPGMPEHKGEPAFNVGYQTLGPILVAFTRLLFRQADRDGVQTLAFVARDGDLLFRIAQELAAGREDFGGFALRYVHLSRRAMACTASDLQHLNADPKAIERVVSELRGIRTMGTPMESFRTYYHVPTELVSPHAARLHTDKGDEADLRRFLSDPIAASDLANVFASIKGRVRRYLAQEGILNGRSALVDIGWRGTLQTLLQSESKTWGTQAPRGYYLGLWNEDSRHFPEHAIGLITDRRRGRSPLEGSAWHVAFFLEAVCRAAHGMVVGFTEDRDGNILPVHIEKGGTREAERESERVQKSIQEGIMAYVQWYRETHSIGIKDEGVIQREAQRRLFELAFFPNQDQCAIGRQLIHSEPTSDDSALWLIADARKGVRNWISGLRSPWKGGYLHSSGGRVAAAIYCAAEGLLSQLPPGTKPAIRRLLLRGR